MLYEVAIVRKTQVVAVPGQVAPQPIEKLIFGPVALCAPSETIAQGLAFKQANLDGIDPAELEVAVRPFAAKK